MYFCSADDIQLGMPVSAASRFNTKYDEYRKTASQSIKTYTRRNWDYNAAYVQYADSPRRQPNSQMNIYLDKVPVDTMVPFDIRFSYDWIWDDTTLLVEGQDYYFDIERRCIVITNLYQVFDRQRAYKLTYAGGLKPLLDIDMNPTDVYDTGSQDMDLLRTLCITEATDRMQTFLNRTIGEQDTIGKNRERIHQKPRIAGMLAEVARQLEQYRKIYVRAI